MDINSKVCEKTTNNISILLDKFVQFWNEKNLDCFADLFTENAEFTDIVGQVAIGKNEIKEQHKFPFSVTMKKATLKLNGIYARALSDTLVIVTAKWQTEQNLMPDGSKAPNREGVIQIIANRTQEEGYKIVLVHNTDLSRTYEQMPASKGKFHTVPE
ncbi:MAG: SgcJ/EcaC family oxidoreductase [Chitinophagales bacterium]|nr:SgcJ/EcaC family oxidoreductase [Chitinophagaceae bacterium]MCB9065828.1 SgcJ/EcaC family oxidoreductase [Chitinophagales bacterium]